MYTLKKMHDISCNLLFRIFDLSKNRLIYTDLIELKYQQMGKVRDPMRQHQRF